MIKQQDEIQSGLNVKVLVAEIKHLINVRSVKNLSVVNILELNLKRGFVKFVAIKLPKKFTISLY